MNSLTETTEGLSLRAQVLDLLKEDGVPMQEILPGRDRGYGTRPYRVAVNDVPVDDGQGQMVRVVAERYCEAGHPSFLDAYVPEGEARFYTDAMLAAKACRRMYRALVPAGRLAA